MDAVVNSKTCTCFSPFLSFFFLFTACKSLLNKKSDSAKVRLSRHLSALFCSTTLCPVSPLEADPFFCLLFSFCTSVTLKLTLSSIYYVEEYLFHTEMIFFSGFFQSFVFGSNFLFISIGDSATPQGFSTSCGLFLNHRWGSTIRISQGK